MSLHTPLRTVQIFPLHPICLYCLFCFKQKKKLKFIMKLLVLCRENFAYYGVHSPLTSTDGLFNKRSAIVLFIYALHVVCATIFFLYKAQNLAEYVDSFTILWSVSISIANFCVLIHKCTDMFQFIERLECAINKSKWQSPVDFAITFNSSEEFWSDDFRPSHRFGIAIKMNFNRIGKSEHLKNQR